MCKGSGRRRQRGASQLELAVSIALFAIFLVVFLERASYYQEYAEKTAMEMTVANMRTGLRYQIADLIINNRLSEIPALADDNPVNWLAGQPENYLGEFDSLPDGTAGKWFYDKRNRELVYTVNNRRHFVPYSGRDFTIHYRAARIQGPANTSARTSDVQAWVELRQPRGYTWLL
jgi:general secretion pathway protein G